MCDQYKEVVYSGPFQDEYSYHVFYSLKPITPRGILLWDKVEWYKEIWGLSTQVYPQNRAGRRFGTMDPGTCQE